MLSGQQSEASAGQPGQPCQGVKSGVSISSNPAGGAGEAVTRPVFRKGLGRLTGLVLLNGLFEFLSLGLFRFWSRTRLRRFYWNHATIDGAPLEYDGRGGELLAGFLRALALLLVPGALIFLGAIALAGLEVLLGPADLAFMLVLMPLIPVALFAARGYRLSRTHWRGIAFHQDGSAWRYALLWMYWLSISLFTLGFAVPWRNVEAHRYRVCHTLYGDLRFGFTGRGAGLIAAWVVPWLCGAGALGLTLWAVLAQQGGAAGVPPHAEELAIGLALAFIVLFIRYRTVEFRYFVRHTTLGPVRFRSNLRSPAVVTLILPHLTVSIILIALNVGLMIHLADTLLANPALAVTADVALYLVLLLASVLVLTMLVSLCYNLLVRYGLLRAVCASLQVENLPELIEAAPAHAPRPRRGEGFAESFDMGAL
jgi:uncharacterized membrane protein YjgN (DUF898 family)